MEWNAWSEGNPPSHHVMLPFTRLLSGPMDYTPGTFDILFQQTKDSPRRRKWNDQDKGNSRVNTTLAKQIANWVILYSPLQMASDKIERATAAVAEGDFTQTIAVTRGDEFGALETHFNDMVKDVSTVIREVEDKSRHIL